ncbi:MAG: hypothetical protein EKK55_05560 [Rhodocyclaceae bacterium]|nr:MAG: hypothetical protein EKK55_05560 [Rhodocyclaceae bacterium]
MRVVLRAVGAWEGDPSRWTRARRWLRGDGVIEVTLGLPAARTWAGLLPPWRLFCATDESVRDLGLAPSAWVPWYYVRAYTLFHGSAPLTHAYVLWPFLPFVAAARAAARLRFLWQWGLFYWRRRRT